MPSLIQCHTHNDVFTASLHAEIDSTTTTAAECANDKHSWKSASLSLALCDCLLDVVDKKILILVRGHSGKRLVLSMCQLPSPGHKGKSSSSKSGVLSNVSIETKTSSLMPYVAESRNSSAILILKEFKVKKCSLATRETAEDFVPASLALITYYSLVFEVGMWN